MDKITMPLALDIYYALVSRVNINNPKALALKVQALEEELAKAKAELQDVRDSGVYY